MKREIETKYTERGKVKHVSRSVYPNHAVSTCFTHMQMNTYGADVAEVIDLVTGKVYAQFSRTKSNRIITHFEYDPHDYKSPIRRSLNSILAIKTKSSTQNWH